MVCGTEVGIYHMSKREVINEGSYLCEVLMRSSERRKH